MQEHERAAAELQRENERLRAQVAATLAAASAEQDAARRELEGQPSTSAPSVLSLACRQARPGTCVAQRVTHACRGAPAEGAGGRRGASTEPSVHAGKTRNTCGSVSVGPHAGELRRREHAATTV